MANLDLTGYHLSFDEEFNARSISQTGAGTTWADIRREWRFDANSDIGFGHSSFVDPASGYDPFSVSGGALTIVARPDRTASGYAGSWESGLITTQGNFSQTYGYFEIRADFSDLPGAWDAFWLLPDRQIPDPHQAGNWQELDVVEHYGDWDRGVYTAIHTTDPQNGVRWQDNRQVYSELTNPAGYHTYGMNWQADRISLYVDGQFVGSQATPSDMHGPMYLLANLATQNTGTNNADLAGVPLTTRIDYIRAYSNDPGVRAVALGTVSAPDGRDPGIYGASTAQAGSPTGATAGPDLLYGTSGNDVIDLLAGGDTYFGLSGNDMISGNTGADILFGNTGLDTLNGGSGADALFGGQGEDSLYGDADNDLLFGNLGADSLFGGQGADTLYGGQGDDVLTGELGNDVLSGDLGADRYVFGTNSGNDVVLGFSQRSGDRLDLQGQTYTFGTAADGSGAALLLLSGGGSIELAGIRQGQMDQSYFA